MLGSAECSSARDADETFGFLQQEQDDEYREQKRQRQAVLDRANELGVKILNTARFLEMFGLEENYFDADHLVTPTP